MNVDPHLVLGAFLLTLQLVAALVVLPASIMGGAWAFFEFVLEEPPLRVPLGRFRVRVSVLALLGFLIGASAVLTGMIMEGRETDRRIEECLDRGGIPDRHKGGFDCHNPREGER